MAESLADIVRVINSTRPLPDILDYIVTEARRLMSAAVCVLHRVDHERSLVIVEASNGLPECLWDIDGLPLYSSRWDEAILARRPVMHGDIRGRLSPGLQPDNLDPRVRRWRETMGSAYAAVMAVPLVVQGAVPICTWPAPWRRLWPSRRSSSTRRVSRIWCKP